MKKPKMTERNCNKWLSIVWLAAAILNALIFMTDCASGEIDALDRLIIALLFGLLSMAYWKLHKTQQPIVIKDVYIHDMGNHRCYHAGCRTDGHRVIDVGAWPVKEESEDDTP